MRLSKLTVGATVLGLVAVLLAHAQRGALAGPDLKEDWLGLTKKAKLGLLDALALGMRTASGGVPYEVELEPEKGTLVYSVDVAQGKESRNVVLNALTGEVVENVVEPEDNSARVVAAGKVDLIAGIRAATALLKGTPFYAVLMAREPATGILVLVVGADGKVAKVWVDGATGVASVAGTPPERPFTESFPEDKADLGPTGRNKYFFLEPGLFWVLEGKEEGKTLRVTCTMLAETKTIDGVECRALEVREESDGVVEEVTRDYHAISKKTGNVYYFGEDVDVYEDGKVIGHEGAWLAGKDDARWGLFVPAIPLLGARYYQEIAPKVALDRAEITGLAEVVETPAGTFRGVLVLEETNPLEPGHRDVKYFAPEVGFLVKEEGNLLLVKHGKK